LPLLLSLLAAMPAGADESPVAWVGRVSTVEGGLSIKPQGGDWADSAVVNDPVAAGMAVKTGAQGRAVLRFGPETIVLAPGTELTIGQADSSGSQFTLKQGRVGVRLARADPALSIEVDSPRGGVWLLTPGDYDIAAGDDHTPERVAALDGRLRITGKGLDRVLTTGSAAMLSGNDPVIVGLEGAGSDDFVASWRPGKSDDDTQSLGYVSAEMTGYDALDTAGTWQTIDGVGPTWFPRDVAADWAPYRNGHWRWIAPWGWTWIDDAAWGFAPSHYGRWARLPSAAATDGLGADTERWGWVPGALVQHPAYMPATVAFLGTAGVGISYPEAFGPAVAWFPLAPDEPYWPRYTNDAAAIRRANLGSLTDLAIVTPGEDGNPPDAVVNGKYRNRRFASAVPRAVFLAGKPVAAALVQLPERRLLNAPLLAGSPQINPAPPPTAMASAANPAGRSMAGAVQTFARILTPRPTLPSRVVLRSAARAPVLARAPVVLAIARQRTLQFHRATPRFIAAANPVRVVRPALRLAAARHASR
jgi:hypothetical protein